MRRFVAITVAVAAVLSSAPPAGAAPAPGYVNSSLVEVDQVPGTVVDVSTTQILYLFSSPPRLTVKDRASGSITTVPPVKGRRDAAGWLTPRGVVSISVAADHTERLYDWRGGRARIDLGPLNAHQSVVVRGSYVIWSNAATLYRRNLDTEETVTVANDALNWGGDLLANGDVYWTSTAVGQIKRYHDGVTQQLTPDPDSSNVLAVADGVNVVHLKNGPCCAGRPYTLWQYDGTADQQLTQPLASSPTPGSSYDVASGWTSYVDSSAQPQQVWLRSPDGVSRQVSDVGGAQPAGQPQIVSVDPTGRTAYTIGPNLYLGVQGQPPVLLASGLGNWLSRRGDAVANFATLVGDRWDFVIGGTVYALSGPVTVTLSLGVEGNGTILVTPYGRSCHEACAVPLAAGATVTLTATADRPGWRFTSWSGACTGTTLTCTLRLDADTAVSAGFHPADTTAPVITGPLSIVPVGAVLSQQVPAAIPLSTGWTATDPEGPIASNQLELAVNGGGFAPVPLDTVTTNSAAATVVPTARYQYRVQATDPHGNVADWSTAAPFSVTTVGPTAVAYNGAWTTHVDASRWFGLSRSTSDPEASVEFRGAEGHDLAIVATTRRSSPRIHVSVDGDPVLTVSTASPQPTYRHVVAEIPLTPGRHLVHVSLAPDESGRFEFEGFIELG